MRFFKFLIRSKGESMGRLRIQKAIFGFLICGALLAYEENLHAQGNILKYACAQTGVKTLDPHVATFGHEFLIVSTLFNGLVRFKPGNTRLEQIEPDLAESWKVSPDGTEWNFILKKGVQWHKGYGEFTAGDVKFSVERVLDPKTTSPFKTNFENIKEVAVLNPYQVKMFLKKPDPAFLLKLIGVRQGVILSQKAVTALKENFGLNPVGSGPFVFKRYVPKDRVEVTANRDYFRAGEKAKIDGINFIFITEEASMTLGLQKGEFHIGSEIDTKEFITRMKNAGLQVETIGIGAAVMLQMNMAQKPFDDLRVRKAIMHGVNKRELAEALYGPAGKVWNTVVPIGYFGHSDHVPQYEYDINKSKKYLAEAGYPNGLEIPMQMSVSPLYIKPMIILQDQLNRVGIKVNLKQVEHPTYHANIRKDVNPLVLYSGMREPDADPWLTQFFHSSNFPPGTNFSHYKAADALIDQARAEMDLKKRSDLYVRIQRMILEDAAALPLYIRLASLARQPYVKYNYPLENSITFHEDRLEYLTIEKK